MRADTTNQSRNGAKMSVDTTNQSRNRAQMRTDTSKPSRWQFFRFVSVICHGGQHGHPSFPTQFDSSRCVITMRYHSNADNNEAQKGTICRQENARSHPFNPNAEQLWKTQYDKRINWCWIWNWHQKWYQVFRVFIHYKKTSFMVHMHLTTTLIFHVPECDEFMNLNDTQRTQRTHIIRGNHTGDSPYINTNPSLLSSSRITKYDFDKRVRDMIHDFLWATTRTSGNMMSRIFCVYYGFLGSYRFLGTYRV